MRTFIFAFAAATAACSAPNLQFHSYDGDGGASSSSSSRATTTHTATTHTHSSTQASTGAMGGAESGGGGDAQGGGGAGIGGAGGGGGDAQGGGGAGIGGAGGGCGDFSFTIGQPYLIVHPNDIDDPVTLTITGDTCSPITASVDPATPLPSGVAAPDAVFPAHAASGQLHFSGSATPPETAVPPVVSIKLTSGSFSHTKTIKVAAGLTSGNVDHSFANGGFDGSMMGMQDATGRGLVIDGTGKILVTGQDSTGRIFVIRFDRTGFRDSGFGASGVADIPIGSFDSGTAIAINGTRIVVAGSATVGGTQGFALGALTTLGALDPAFGTGGTESEGSMGQGNCRGVNVVNGGLVTTCVLTASTPRQTVISQEPASGMNPPTTLAILPKEAFASIADGNHNLVVAGTNNGNFWITRLKPGGAVDNTFGTAGEATFDFAGGNDTARGLALVGGKIVVAGESSTRVALVRLNSNGQSDMTFPTTASNVQMRFVGSNVLAVDSQGRLIVGGNSPTLGSRPAIARFKSTDGTPDPTFPIVPIQVGGGMPGTPAIDGVYGIAVDDIDRVIVSATTQPNLGQPHLVVQRIWP